MPIKSISPERPDDGIFVDLESILNGNMEPEMPTIGSIGDSSALFYPARVNEIHGEPGLGKTNVALVVISGLLRKDSKVVFIDPEDNPKAICRRLISFGVEKDKIIQNLQYSQQPNPEDLDRVADWARKEKPHFVVIDGFAELIAAQQKSEDCAVDVLPFMNRWIKPFAESGAGVLVTDHVTKSSEGRGRYARGSSAKLGKYDGAVYEVKSVKGYCPGEAGHLKLILTKDRHGGVGTIGSVAAEVHFMPNGEQTSTEIIKPGLAITELDEVMEKIMEKVNNDEQCTTRDLREFGKSQRVDNAIEMLKKGGYLEVTPQGRGKSTIYKILKPYPG